MKNTLLKSGLLLICGVVLGGASLPAGAVVFASETGQNITETDSVVQSNMSTTELVTTIVNEVATIANQYIHFDNTLGAFVLDNTIENVLSEADVAQVVAQINATNSQLQSSKIEANSGTQVNVVDPSGTEFAVKPVFSRAAGVNSVTYYWNYARIKIKASSLTTALNVGFAIGTVYAPARIIQGVCAVVLGAAIPSNIKNGIWFDYNYAIGVLTGNYGKQ